MKWNFNKATDAGTLMQHDANQIGENECSLTSLDHVNEMHQNEL